MRRIAVVIAVVVALGGVIWLEILPITGLLIDWNCSEPQASASCQVRMRALGHLWSRRGNLDDAEKWYLRAAEAGDAASMFHLGWAYQQEAVADMRRGQTQGTAALAALANPEALKKLAQRIEDQHKAGVHPDIRALIGFPDSATAGIAEHAVLAAVWYRMAAERGFAPAMNNLGELYRHGLIGEDQAAARDWFVAAARAGNPLGYWNAWIAYSSGPERDPAELAKWSSWTAPPGIAADLAEPTFGRTTRFGVPMPPDERAAYRQAALTGAPMTIKVEPMKPDPRIPTFRERTGVDPATR